MVEKEILSELEFLKNDLQNFLKIDLKDLKIMPKSQFLFKIIKDNEILDYYDSEVYQDEYIEYTATFFQTMRNLSLYLALKNILADESKMIKANFIDNFMKQFKDKLYVEFDCQTIESLRQFTINYIKGISDIILKECCLEKLSTKKII